MRCVFFVVPLRLFFFVCVWFCQYNQNVECPGLGLLSELEGGSQAGSRWVVTVITKAVLLLGCGCQ